MSMCTRNEFVKGVGLGAATIAAAALPCAALADETTYDYEADVIVVGGGGAGLMAAANAGKNGATSIVFEKASVTGGDSRLSEQDVLAFWPEHTLKDIGEADDYDNYLNDWISTHEFSSVKGLRGDPAPKAFPFAERFMQTWPAAGAFLEDELGIVFKPFFSGNSLATKNTFEPRTFRGQSIITDEVTEYLEGRDDCQIFTKTEVTSLIQDETGRVVGVSGLDANFKPFTAKANKGVVICTGTFNANPGMVAEYVSPIYAMCQPGGCLTVTGDGHKMAAAIGAKLVDMDLGLNWINPPVGTNVLLLIHNWQENFGPGDNYIAPADPAICVNLEGERFYNELLGYNGMARATAEQWHQISFYLGDSLYDTSWTKDCDVVLWGDTIEELAEKMCVDPAVLRQTVDRYNGFVDNGVDEDFGKDVTSCTRIEQGPFYALIVTARHYVTLGGIASDVDCRVLDTDDASIPGLYAAGVCCGSHWEQEGLLYYGGLNQALSDGWQVGAFVAQEA